MDGRRAPESAPAVELQGRVRAALLWDPAVDASTIGVAVTDGIVTLTGETRTFKELLAVRRTVLGVAGVHAIADELRVGPSEPRALSDATLAHRIIEMFDWSSDVDTSAIQVRVSAQLVELTGVVSSPAIAETAVRLATGLRGVRRVDDHLLVLDRSVAESPDHRS